MINPTELNTDELYYSNEEYMSVSKYKLFNKCETMGLRGFGEQSKAMLVGSYVDAFVEGTLEDFTKTHPNIFSSRGSTKGQLLSEFKQANVICDYISNDAIIQQFLSGEKQTVMTGEIENVPFKIKMDSYSKGIAISDLKVMRNITNQKGDYINFISQYGYDIQLACYQEIVYQNTGEKLPCYIVAVTKEEPINSAVIHIPQTVLDIALFQVKNNIERVWRVSIGEEKPTRCEKCSACIGSRESSPIISMLDMEE